MSRRRVRLAAALLAGAAGLVVAYGLALYLGAAIATGVARLLVLLPDAMMWLLISMREGADGLTIAGDVAARVAGALTRPQLILALIALELVGAAALYALKRLLRDETRAPRSEEIGR